MLGNLLQYFAAVSRFAGYLQVVFRFEESPETLSNDAVVVCYED